MIRFAKITSVNESQEKTEHQNEMSPLFTGDLAERLVRLRQIGELKSIMQCPTCKKEVAVPAEGAEVPKHFPFCCERCKLIDLGRWLDGKYQVPVVDHRGDDADQPPRH